jgi:fumarate hydratase class I
MAKRLDLPITADQARALRVGDEVLVSGRLLTGRGPAHQALLQADDARLRAITQGSAIYHCAPVASQDPATGAWHFVAAGPSTSMRVEEWQAGVIARYGLRAVIGKGGMGPATLAALQEHGAAYLHAVGGLAVVLARTVVRVRGVHRLAELGAADALWDVEVRDYPAVVTMDAEGQSLHQLADAEAGLSRPITS